MILTKSNQNQIIKLTIKYHQIHNFKRILSNFLQLMILLNPINKIITIDKVILEQIMYINNNHIRKIKDNIQETKMISNFNKT